MIASRIGKPLFAALLVLIITAGWAGQAIADGPQDEEAHQIASELACPVCEGQSVADSSAPLAQQMRTLIRKKLANGESRDDILQYFVDRYGEGILRAPPRQGFNQILWLLPTLSLIGGTCVLVFLLHYWRSHRQSLDSSDFSEVDDKDLARYEEQLAEELERQS